MTQTTPHQWSEFYLKDVTFANLMMRRIYNVLIVANPYDAFMLEDDGRIEEKIYNEYMGLGMRYPPTFTQVSCIEEAEDILEKTNVDLVICMPGNADNDAFDVARAIKNKFATIPCVVLTPFSHGITKRIQNEDLSIFDYIFCWLGNTNLILSIIKLIEDKMNIEQDIAEAGVQIILLVEDSIRFYSSILPSLYNFILAQSKRLSTEALNNHAAILRQRGRPKVVLARNYEEAMAIYRKYSDNTLGVISDACFEIEGQKDARAGFKLLNEIRKKDEYVPLIMQSSEQTNREEAEKCGFRFVDKNSKKMSLDLRAIMEEHMGFGDFIFRDPLSHKEIMRVKSLKELQDNIFSIPNSSMLYHISRNHMSRWLCARAIFPVSAFLKNITWHKLQDVDAHRQIIFDAIVQYRHMKNIGVVAVFDKHKFDKYAHFARIGEGSLGGKGRGLAFLDNIIKVNAISEQYSNITVQIPKTLVLCTDIFDEFMEKNNLYPIALSDVSDQEILNNFLKAKLPKKFRHDFITFFNATNSPIAIRSSSLLEDAHYQPFAGIYSTYMIPYIDNKQEMLKLLELAIKGVYASVFYKDSKAYMTATSNVIDQEKMAVILQEVVGQKHQNMFYPNVSGVLRSINHYPIGNEKPNEGVVSLALGLGKYIVDGGKTLRVSPYHPNHIMQLSDVKSALTTTQNVFYALNLDNISREFCVNDDFNIEKLKVSVAQKHGTLNYIASTYNFLDNSIVDGVHSEGRKIISFKTILQHNVFPFSSVLQLVQKCGVEAMKRPIEIEFACNINNTKTADLYLLQIRPIANSVHLIKKDINSITKENCLIKCNKSLGHGIIEDICDVVFVKYDDNFTAEHNREIAIEIEEINKKFVAQNKNYIAIAPGRWGTSDYWLGIPIKWSSISAAKVIVETEIKGYSVEPSQGSHFFQNLTSFGVGYLTIEYNDDNSFIKQELLNSMPAIYETQFVKHVRFNEPLKIYMDGKKQQCAIVFKETDNTEL